MRGSGEIRREPTEVIVLFLSSIEQSGGSSKKVMSLSLTGKWEPLVHCIWVENGVTIKAPVPAAKPGRHNVIGLGFPKLQIGGELVELKLQVSADQMVMITR